LCTDRISVSRAVYRQNKCQQGCVQTGQVSAGLCTDRTSVSRAVHRQDKCKQGCVQTGQVSAGLCTDQHKLAAIRSNNYIQDMLGEGGNEKEKSRIIKLKKIRVLSPGT
jgi:hypothetical protein